MPNQKPAEEDSKNKKIIEKITSILQRRSEKALNTAKKIILTEKVECREINEAFEYYAKNWSDYIHPGLISVACEAVNGNPEDSILMQVIMLLFNAAFDIHDDIIDESRTKYKMPTIFGRFGKDVALLVGDAFLIKALLLLHKLERQVSTEKMNVIWGIIERQFFNLGDAEALEASFKGNVNISPEKCLHILEKKASNFEAHMRIGATIGGGGQSEVALLGAYGRALGISGFIREDFIDLFEPDELQNRVKNECLPLPMLYAFRKPQIKKDIMILLSKPKISDKDAEKIVDTVCEEKSVKIFKNRIHRLAEKTLKDLSRLGNPNLKSQMQTLIMGVLEDL